MSRHWFVRRPMLASGVMVAVVLVVIAPGTAHIEPESGEWAVNAGAYLLGITAALALLAARAAAAGDGGDHRRRELFTYLAVAYPPGPVLMTGPISLVLLGIRAAQQALIGAASMACAVIVGQLIGSARLGIVAAAVGWLLAAVFAGELAGARRERAHAERERRRLVERQAISDSNT